MKKKNQNRLIRFVFSFSVFTAIATSLPHFFSSKGMGPLPWKTIFDHWGFLFFLALFTAIEYTYELDAGEPFWEKLRKRRKKKGGSKKDD